MDRIFEYAIVRLTAAPHRGEQVNIGLAVFSPDGLDVRLHPSSNLVRAMGADVADVDWIPTTLAKIDDNSLDVTDRARLLGQCPGISLSAVGWFVAEGDDQYEARLSRIREELVDRPKVARPKVKRSNLVREIREELREHEILGRNVTDLDHHKVVSNIPFGPANKLHIDFLVRNGAFHATETIDFRRSLEAGTTEIRDAAVASCTLRFAREHLGANSTRCYFAFAAPRVVEASIRPALQLVERDADDCFNLESREDKRRFVDLMLAAAGSPGLFSP